MQCDGGMRFVASRLAATHTRFHTAPFSQQLRVPMEMLTAADRSAVSALESATSAAVTAFFAIPEDARPDACAFVGQHRQPRLGRRGGHDTPRGPAIRRGALRVPVWAHQDLYRRQRHQRRPPRETASGRRAAGGHRVDKVRLARPADDRRGGAGVEGHVCERPALSSSQGQGQGRGHVARSIRTV